MLPTEKLKFNIRNLIHFKGKSNNIKLTSDNNSKKDISTNTIGPLPSLNDMEFNWIEDN
jgi:hypothetical protein